MEKVIHRNQPEKIDSNSNIEENRKMFAWYKSYLTVWTCVGGNAFESVGVNIPTKDHRISIQEMVITVIIEPTDVITNSIGESS